MPTDLAPGFWNDEDYVFYTGEFGEVEIGALEHPSIAALAVSKNLILAVREGWYYERGVLEVASLMMCNSISEKLCAGCDSKPAVWERVDQAWISKALRLMPAWMCFFEFSKRLWCLVDREYTREDGGQVRF